MQKRKVLLGSLATAGLVAGLLPIGIGSAGADVPAPAFWPDGAEVGANAYTMRMFGDNRYETALAIAATQVNGNRDSGYPFEQDLPVNLRGNDGDPANTYGLSLAACPETIHVGVGDNPADTLAASGVKGITNLPLPGTGVLTNVTNALVLLTDAARGNPGAVLNPRTREALLYVRNTCNKPFNAVILGGPAAVSVTAAAEVDAIANVTARVDGSGLQQQILDATGVEIPLDRYATAAELALLLFQAASPGGAAAGLPDINVWDSTVNDDGTWDFETNATPDDTFADAVFLTEGVKGADPLALGPVAAAYSSPVLLTRPDELPVASIAALTIMNPRSLIVIGGEAAVSADVVTAALAAAGETVDYTPDSLRVAGPTRYSTAVGVATVLAGAVRTQRDGALYGFARSDRNDGTDAVDALAGGAFLDTAQLVGATAPWRQAPPIERNGAIGGDLRGATIYIGQSTEDQNGIWPMLLVTPGTALDSGVPAPVVDYLETLYAPPPPGYVTGESANPVADANGDGGFGFLFGGEAAIGAGTSQDIAALLSGGTYAPQQIDDNLDRYNAATDIDPTATVNDIYFTDLDMVTFGVGGLNFGATSTDGGGVDADQSTGLGRGIPKICVYRDGLMGVARIAHYGVLGSDGDFFSSIPVDYQNKVPSPTNNNSRSLWTPYQSRQMCINVQTVNGAAGVGNGEGFAQILPVGIGATFQGGAVVRFQSLSGNEAQGNGRAIQSVQDQLALSTPVYPVGLTLPPQNLPTSCWVYDKQGQGQIDTCNVTYQFGAGGFFPPNFFAGLSSVINNYRGIGLTALETGTISVTVTREGISPANTENAVRINGTIVFDPVAGSAFPAGLTLNFKAETDQPNLEDFGVVPVGPAFQVFSGMYSVGPQGQGPTGGFQIGFARQNVLAPTFDQAPNIFVIGMMGNA